MAEQPSSSDVARLPKHTKDRVFFAVFADTDAASRIHWLTEELRRNLGLKGVPQSAERLHVTLFFIGDFLRGLPQARIRAAITVAASVASPVFEVGFDRVGSFAGRAGRNPLVLQGGDELAPLRAFREVLKSTLAHAGFRDDSPYTPHATLLYDSHFVEEQRIEPIRWVVSEFALVHSLVGASTYRMLARWRLASA